LPDRIDLQIIEGFRPLSQQAFMYEALMRELAQEHPEWDEATLHQMTNRLSAPPDDPCPPPHSTGGAVDVRLVRMPRHQPLDLSSPYAMEDTESAPTEVKGLTPEARTNRCLLIRTLEATGLTNYTGEWWHWSYGDSGWALRTGAPYALYDRIAAA
jgi:D-alanyl-D-alanine dipeptidase